MQGTPAAEQVERVVLARFISLVTKVGQYNRRKIAGSTAWSQHSWANALDIHIGTNMANGDIIYAWLSKNKAALGIKNILWRVAGHYDHLHIDVWPKGVYTPPLTSTGIGSFRYSSGKTTSARIQLIAPQVVVPEATEIGEVNVLKKGDKGLAVANLQADLIARGYNLGDWPPFSPSHPKGADGSFGNDTVTAVVAEQKRLGLTQNGIVDGVLSVELQPVSSGVDATARNAAAAAAKSAAAANTRLDKLHTI